MKFRGLAVISVALAVGFILTQAFSVAFLPRMREARVSVYTSGHASDFPFGLKECVESWPAVSAPKDYYDARWSEAVTPEASALRSR